jgi:hypothetical protein
VGLEQGPLKFVNTIEELLGRKNSGSGKKTENMAVGNLLHWPNNALYPQKLLLTSPTKGGQYSLPAEFFVVVVVMSFM